MANKNYQIAKFYSHLFDLREALISNIIPMGNHIGTQTEDAELMESLENTANAIERHLESYRLSIEVNKQED